MCGTAGVPSDLTTTSSDGKMVWADSTVEFCFRIGFGVGPGSVLCCWIMRVSTVWDALS